MEDAKVNRNYKDTLFRMIFKEKENLLSLYNAVNGTDYTDVDALEITTLEDAVYMNYKNDVSFVFDFELALYEHQSTENPNMPLRDLIYVSKVIQGIIKEEDIFGTKLIKLPTPRFAVFYNGTTSMPQKQVLKLSDAYEKQVDNPELELIVTIYNINYGSNPELLETCQVLREYAEYVEQVRKYAKEKPLAEAVEQAVDYCIKNNILADFLKKNRAEAIEMCIFEYDEEKHMRCERKFWMEKGRMEGEARGRAEGEARGRAEGEARGRAEGEARGKARGKAEEIIETGVEFGLTEEDILGRLQRKLSISLKEAQEYMEMFGKQPV